jgi:hypothetical protein
MNLRIRLLGLNCGLLCLGNLHRTLHRQERRQKE